MTNRIEALKEMVQPYYQSDDPGHDWLHIQRVGRNALMIAKNEIVDEEALLAGAYCHDLINISKDHPDRAKASELSANASLQLLKEAGFEESEIRKIQTIIIEHSFSRGAKPSTAEAAILQDADRLDAIGAIGILRCATTTVQMGSLLYHQDEPLAENRALNDKLYMLDHYYKKLYLLPDLMNTEIARETARKRIAFMKLFEENLLEEIDCSN